MTDEIDEGFAVYDAGTPWQVRTDFDCYKAGFLAARAAEPEQPASGTGSGQLALATGWAKLREEKQAYRQQAWELGYASGYDDREKMDHDRADVIKTENPFGEPAEPPHPSNEELVAKALEAHDKLGLAMMFLVDPQPVMDNEHAWHVLKDVLSELERRLTVKA